MTTETSTTTAENDMVYRRLEHQSASATELLAVYEGLLEPDELRPETYIEGISTTGGVGIELSEVAGGRVAYAIVSDGTSHDDDPTLYVQLGRTQSVSEHDPDDAFLHSIIDYYIPTLVAMEEMSWVEGEGLLPSDRSGASPAR